MPVHYGGVYAAHFIKYEFCVKYKGFLGALAVCNGVTDI
jgi:hypothetical protein